MQYQLRSNIGHKANELLHVISSRRRCWFDLDVVERGGIAGVGCALDTQHIAVFQRNALSIGAAHGEAR